MGPVASENKSSSNAKEPEEDEPPMITFLLEEIILKHAKKPSRVTKNSTDEEKKADRLRRLNAKSTRWRIIFSQWPRDPNGKTITAENSCLGKMTPHRAQLWGATLFNFYSVRRFPNLMHLKTFSTGSKLAAWMKANGEDYAKSMLEFCENEPDPHVIQPYPISGLIQDGDAFMFEKSWIRDDGGGDDDDMSGKGKGKAREYWQVPQPWPPASPFDPLAYPKPWPSEPFTKEVVSTRYPTLQKYIIHSHLPTILKVHDPWSVLCATRIHSHDYDEKEAWEEMKCKNWSDLTDVVHTYRLKTSTRNTVRRTEDDKIAKEEEERREVVYDTFISDPHSRNKLPSGMVYDEDPAATKTPGPAKPPIFVIFPFLPPLPPAREAHLYLSPAESIGEGNHSFVYRAELELPRSTLMDDEICYQCIKEDTSRILKEQDGPNGERRDPKWDEKVGCYNAKTVGKPPLTISVSDEEEYIFEPSTLREILEYDGPYRVIHSNIGYQRLERGPYCEHIAKSPRGIHPLTAKVKVAAKLSIPNDSHLGREAETYQAFPRYFFEHWSGFNVIKPLHDPTPVGPMVPQFYGYYVPDADSDGSQCGRPQYRSPILLLEDCGAELDPASLTLDDRSEAAALVFRFHDAGWIHGSVAKRNILIQPGPLSDFPLSRYNNSEARGGHGVHWGFRLIDFGRCFEMKIQTEEEMRNLLIREDMDIQRWIFFDGDLN